MPLFLTVSVLTRNIVIYSFIFIYIRLLLILYKRGLFPNNAWKINVAIYRYRVFLERAPTFTRSRTRTCKNFAINKDL